MKTLKKLTAVLLAVVMTLAMASVSFAVAAESDIPTLIIYGRKNQPFYKADGTPVADTATPCGMSREEYIKKWIKPVLKELAVGVATDNYDKYVDTLIECARPIYEEEVLPASGEADNGTHIKWDYQKNMSTAVHGGKRCYVFYYDWRLSPVDIADQLDVYIERILAANGADKINITARCLASNMAMAYVAKSHEGAYGHPFRVANLAFDTPALAGYITVGALMSGSIHFDADVIDRFVTSYLNNNDLFEDESMELLASTLVTFINHAKVLGLTAGMVNKIYKKVSDKLISGIALVSYGRYPSYWSMISDEYYDKAVAQIFNTPELAEEYAGLIAKANEYHELLSDTNEETGRPKYADLLLELKEEGVNTAVFGKYGAATVPMFDGCEITGDTRGTVTETTLGATATTVYKKFSSAYMTKAEANGTIQYIAADRTVDTSTCLFPDSTWVMKNVAHDVFLDSTYALINDFFASDGSLTVEESSRARFTDYNNGDLKSVETADNGTWTKNPLVLLLKLLTALFKVFVNMLNKQ